MSNFSQELKRYTIIQILDFVHEQVDEKFVSRSMMRNLKTGVENICNEAFGRDNLKAIKAEVPRIVRASLEAKQMGIGGKVLRFLDARRKKQTNEINSIFTDILNCDKSVKYSKQTSVFQKSKSQKSLVRG